MKKLLLPVAALLAFQSFAATNYALRTNGARFAGPVQANRAIDGKTDTYWGFHPYPKGFVLKLQDTCKIDTLKIVFYKVM